MIHDGPVTDNPQTPPITAYVRTLNEERLIGKVVQAAQLIAREVIIIDSGSTDRTIAIATEAGAKVLEQKWLGWGRQKRPAEEAAQHDWLLDLDADEVITEAFAEEVAALFANGDPSRRIYRTYLALALPTGDIWRDFGLQTRHKLYDRRVVRMPDHDGWDQFRLPKGEPVGIVHAPMLHYAFTDIEHLVSKLNRNSSIPAPAKSRASLALRIFFGLPIYAAKRYFLQQYFRGGVYGAALAIIYGWGRWLRDIKMWEHRSQDTPKTRD